MRLLSVVLFLPLSALAGGFYECVSADGVKSYQLDRCSRGQVQQRIQDDTAPKNVRVDRVGEVVTTQVLKSGAHYHGTGFINGTPFRMMVDTGASFVSISRDQALGAGVSLWGRSVRMQTANGIVSGVLSTAKSISFAGHEVKNVSVVVQTGGKPFPGVLLGMSFLSHFDVNMSGSVMSLTRK